MQSMLVAKMPTCPTIIRRRALFKLPAEVDDHTAEEIAEVTVLYGDVTSDASAGKHTSRSDAARAKRLLPPSFSKNNLDEHFWETESKVAFEEADIPNPLDKQTPIVDFESEAQNSRADTETNQDHYKAVATAQVVTDEVKEGQGETAQAESGAGEELQLIEGSQASDNQGDRESEPDYKGESERSPNTWSAVVISPPTFTPPGYVVMVVRRLREPNWKGPLHLRPFVNTKIPCEDFVTIQQKQKLDPTNTTTVRLKLLFSSQSFKDDLRVFEKMLSSVDKAPVLNFYLESSLEERPNSQ
ncbi:hypothetical protein PVAG01_03786 [Phlyctema vagabunda]|uniref:Uncharacterized protein n=1 Tax=Phlyctema vagabunda TaxID=108571 RepID=A0ABR4PMH4_9HELO